MEEGAGRAEQATGTRARTAGGVLILRTTESGPRLAVLEAGGLLSLPRAEVGPGESAETAARRAAQHFVGTEVRLVEPVGTTVEAIEGGSVSTSYWLGSARLSALLRPATQPPTGFTLRWLDFEEALDVLHSDDERDLVARFAQRSHPARQRLFASAEHRELIRDIEAFRDDTLAHAAATDDPQHLDALQRARAEIERAEARLARGDDAGARRARARAERETLVALDAAGRAHSLRRALARFPAVDDAAGRVPLDVAVPNDGEPVTYDALLAAHTALDAALQSHERSTARRRQAQRQTTLAVATGGLAGLALGSLMSGGLADVSPGATVALTLACAFAAGCAGCLALRR